MESITSPINPENKYSSLLPTRESFSIIKITYKGNFKDMYLFVFIQCNQISATAYNKKLDVIVTADTG